MDNNLKNYVITTIEESLGERSKTIKDKNWLKCYDNLVKAANYLPEKFPDSESIHLCAIFMVIENLKLDNEVEHAIVEVSDTALKHIIKIISQLN